MKHVHLVVLMVALAGALLCALKAAESAASQVNEGNFTTHTSNVPSYNTPLTTDSAGNIYLCYIDPGLKTVVVKKDVTTGQWSAPTVLTSTTTAEKFHTQCSLALDRYGFLHAAYNMQGTPWQYKVSAIPYSITTMVFKGQDAGTGGTDIPAEAGCTGECEANWMKDEPGIAAIPGNQITYPHFGYDSAGDLYVVFRECYYCTKTFHERQWSMGIAKYDPALQTWTRVGKGAPRPFATEAGKLTLGARLFGDPFGRLHLSFLVCNPYNQHEGGQGCYAHPNFVSYAFTADGGQTWHTSQGVTYPLPLTSAHAEQITTTAWFTDNNVPGYYDGKTGVMASLKNAAKPFITVHANTPNSSQGVPARAPIIYNTSQAPMAWENPPRTLSYSPSYTYEDRSGAWIAVSSGLRVHRSTDQGKTWQITVIDEERGPFSLAYDYLYLVRTNRLRLYANNGEDGLLTIWTISFDE